MSETMSVHSLEKIKTFEFQVSAFGSKYGEGDITVTRQLLLDLQANHTINLDYWFRDKHPDLYGKYQLLAKPVEDEYWKQWTTHRNSIPMLKHNKAGYLTQYWKSRQYLNPLEINRDARLANIMADLLGLP